MKPRNLSVVLLLALVLAACNLPAGIGVKPGLRGTQTATTQAGIETRIAQTVMAGLSQTAPAAGQGAGTPGAPPAASPTAAVLPSQTPRPPAEPTILLPSETRPAPTSTPTSPTSCDQAAFVDDVTIPDGTTMAPGQEFTKTWRLQNASSCTWGSGYAAVFFGGESMDAPSVVNLPGNIPPGGTFDLTVGMKAPNSTGRFTGFWKLRDNQNAIFGTGTKSSPFFVKVEVIGITATPTLTPTITLTPTTVTSADLVYDLAANMCQAEWRSLAGILPCPGTQGDNKGYMLRLSSPELETGVVEANPVLLTFPQNEDDGAITGRFPAIAIQDGYHFQAVLGCVYGANQCSVIYQVNYIIGNADVKNLDQWTHVYSGSVQGVDIDLSPLAGQPVQIVLAVLANGPATGDQAVWVFPRIVKE